MKSGNSNMFNSRLVLPQPEAHTINILNDSGKFGWCLKRDLFLSQYAKNGVSVFSVVVIYSFKKYRFSRDSKHPKILFSEVRCHRTSRVYLLLSNLSNDK